MIKILCRKPSSSVECLIIATAITEQAVRTKIAVAPSGNATRTITSASRKHDIARILSI
jgi:hypothetical protein